MKYLTLFAFFVFLNSCSEHAQRRRKVSSSIEPYTITITEPNDANSFYRRLYDSLDLHISKMSNNRLVDFKGAQASREFVIGWLYDQFCEPVYGLGDRAGLSKEQDRASDEFELKKPGDVSSNKVSFTVTYLTDHIPQEWLSPTKWRRRLIEQNLYNEAAIEKEKFKRSGSLTRNVDGKKDTLYGYPYKLDIAIKLFYIKGNKQDTVTSAFIIPAQTMVYHHLKLQTN